MPSGLATVHRLRPEVGWVLDDAVEQADAACPAGLLGLCRARVRMLLGGAATVSDSHDEKTRSVADYPTSPLFSDVERLALEFTEQFVIDVAGMPDDLVAALRDHLGTEGVYALAMGLYAVDQAERLDLSAAVHPGGAA
jgi:hypothetical protein